MIHWETKAPSKARQRFLVGGLLLLVIAGGAASFLFNGGGPQEDEEEIMIVDLSLPPPPPPPPPPPVPEEDRSEPEEAMDDAPEISDADTTELSNEPTTDIDLGIDAGDLGSGPGGAFIVSLPRFSRGGGGGGGGDGMMDEMDSPPTPVGKIQPTYPSSLLSKGVGGRVLVVCVVDEKGQVVSTSIRQSAGHPDLDKAAIAAVTKWKFKPATKAGRPTRASCTVPFNFEVKKS
jgi:periplasmic protein TonB